MRNSDEIIRQAETLPAEERARIADALPRSLSPPDPLVDNAWTKLALNRLSELRSGTVDPVPGEDVLAKLRARFGRP